MLTATVCTYYLAKGSVAELHVSLNLASFRFSQEGQILEEASRPAIQDIDPSNILPEVLQYMKENEKGRLLLRRNFQSEHFY
jgi:hypothetical protein